jgi:hypothetical protein
VPRSCVGVGIFPAGKVSDLTLQISVGSAASVSNVNPVAWFDGVGPTQTNSGQLRFVEAGFDIVVNRQYLRRTSHCVVSCPNITDNSG